MVSYQDVFTGDGTTIKFNLSFVATSPLSKVTVNGTEYIEGTDFTVDYNTYDYSIITFITAPAIGFAIIVQYNTTLEKTSEDVANAILAELAENQDEITDFNVGSVGRNMIEAVASQIGTSDDVAESIYAEFQAVYESAFIDTAVGDDLDELTALVGVTRTAATKSTGTVTFTRVSGGSGDITISAGTYVSTVQSGTSDAIRFVTTADATMISANTTVDVAIESENTGVDNNVGANTITVIESLIAGISSVTNTAATSGGTDTETDTALRARAKLALDVAGKGTESAIEGALLEISEIIEVTVNDRAYLVEDESDTFSTGTSNYTLSNTPVSYIKTITGTAGGAAYTFLQGIDFELSGNDVVFEIGGTDPDDSTDFYVDYVYIVNGAFNVVVSGNGTLSASVMSTVNDTIDDAKAAGINYSYTQSAFREIDISINVTKSAGEDSNEIEAAVESALTNYLDGLSIGDDVYVAKIYDIVMSVSGVLNAQITSPGYDITIYSAERATTGTLTITVS